MNSLNCFGHGRSFLHRFILEWTLVVVLSFLSGNAMAASIDSARMQQRIALYGGFRDPYPSNIGFNMGYQAADFLRLTVGVGELFEDWGNFLPTDTGTAFGTGAKFLVPRWEFSPVAGLNYAYLKRTKSAPGYHLRMTENEGLVIEEVRADHPWWKNESGGHVYLNLGVEWALPFGGMIGIGLQRSLRAADSDVYLTAGWFF